VFAFVIELNMRQQMQLFFQHLDEPFTDLIKGLLQCR